MDYDELVREARAFLKGRSARIQQEFAQLMEDASADLDFERAAVYRDRIRALTQIQRHQGINPRTVAEADVFAAYSQGGQTCIQVFFFRAHQNWGNRAYFPRHDKEQDTVEVLDAFLAQFYEDREPPRLILLNEDVPNRELLQEALNDRSERSVAVGVPRRGEKYDLVQQAHINAREALGRRLAESSTQGKLLEGVAELFDLPRPPTRIEVYDNSHIQGTKPVGCMIVAGPEGFMKNQYRKFNIRSSSDDTKADGETRNNNDIAMMCEMLTRRFSRLTKEKAERIPNNDLDQADHEADCPDLILIDGGAGQLKAAIDVLTKLGIENIAAVGVAKGPEHDAGRERFFVPGRDPFMLEPRNPVLYYLQRLRDEAHRFAIGTHRARRTKTITANPLDEVPGIGPGRKRALLRHFGSARAVAGAGLTDLEAVGGISAKVARTIYDFFRGTPGDAA